MCKVLKEEILVNVLHLIEDKMHRRGESMATSCDPRLPAVAIVVQKVPPEVNGSADSFQASFLAWMSSLLIEDLHSHVINVTF